MEFNKEQAYEIYLENKSLTDATKQWCEDNNLPYEDRYMHRLKRYVKSNEKEDFDTTTQTETNQYSNDNKKKEVFMPSAWDVELNRFLTIDEYCEKYGLDKESVRSSKLVAHVAGHMVYNIAFNATVFGEDGLDLSAIDKIIQKHIEPLETKKVENIPDKYDKWFDRLVYTDTHVGMDVNADGDPLYDGKWDKEELFKRLDLMVNHVLKYSTSNTLIIDDLGDFLDGFDASTTRKSHTLPQNMNNKECFEIGLEFKIALIDKLINRFDFITCNNICNDNHSGDWGYVVNYAFKKFMEQRYPNKVIVNNYKRFINHYQVGRHTFIITHGKDKESLKFGFKPELNSQGYEKIDQFCKEHKLYNGNYIEFSMGDQHQYKSDYTTSNDFVYKVYPAFSPPSNWVKSNFKKTKSGFVLYNIDKESQLKVSIPYIFEKQ